MLIVILFLIVIGMIVSGHVMYAKAKVGDEVSDIHYYGYAFLGILLVIISIVHFVTVGNAIKIESQYYTYYTYSQEITDNILIIPISSLEGKLIPKGSGDNQSTNTVSLDKVREDVFYYNQSLYSVRHWANDPFVGLIIEKPNADLKPIILR
jgi:hypothetical protein